MHWACTAIAMQQTNKQRCMQPVSRERIGKHVPAAKITHTVTVLLLETVFSTLTVQRCYKEDNSGDPVVVSWQRFGLKSACEEKTRRLAWNGRQPGC
jgi:hypothetical protein